MREITGADTARIHRTFNTTRNLQDGEFSVENALDWIFSGNDDRANTRSVTSKTEAGLGTDSQPMTLGSSGHQQPPTPAQRPNSPNFGNQTFVDLTGMLTLLRFEMGMPLPLFGLQTLAA